jgi:hypothetical protein
MESKTSIGGQDRSDFSALSRHLEALTISPSHDVRGGGKFVDEKDATLGSSDSDDGEAEESSGYDSQLEAAAWEESLARVDDEDWEIAEGGTYMFFLPFRVIKLTSAIEQISPNLIIV